MLTSRKIPLRITEYPELGGNHEDHRVQFLTPHRAT